MMEMSPNKLWEFLSNSNNFLIEGEHPMGNMADVKPVFREVLPKQGTYIIDMCYRIL